MAEVVSIEEYRPARGLAGTRVGRHKVTVFNRNELDLILQVYGRNVVAGRWRDYALDFAPSYASFAVVRGGAQEGPTYQILKWSGKGSAPYAVLGGDGQVLRRGADLRAVLKVFDGAPRVL
ncbi:MAG: DUF2794 domain-containing protein [Alphaproteobacteria bacterium]|nr:DUF2794 domain-containing protein [Alphaproteobacteria bacterium]